MLWLKAFHLIAIVTWFAGLFYLPRLFVYHAMATDPAIIQTFKIMERKLYFGIVMPGAIFTLIFGIWLYILNPTYYLHAPWMWIKLLGVLLLIIFHILCGVYWWEFRGDRNQHTHIFYRWFNEIPTALLLVIVIMVIVQPVL